MRTLKRINLELTNCCQLNCPLCPAGNGADRRPASMMDWRLIERALSSKHLELVYLWNYGEPTLNPMLVDTIRLATDRGIRSVVSTNGLRLGSSQLRQRLPESGLSTLIVSIDGLTAATYEHYRRGASFDDLLSSLLAFRPAIEPSPVEYVVQFTVMQHNVSDLASLSNFATENGFNTFDVKTVTNLRPADDPLFFEEVAPFLPDEASLRRPVFRDRAERRVPLLGYCPGLQEGLAVGVDGAIVPCCWDSGYEYLLGSLWTHSLDEVFHGEAVDRMLEAIKAGVDLPSMCSICPARYPGIGYLRKRSAGDRLEAVDDESPTV